MYAYLIHKTVTSYKNTVPEAENQFELPTRSTINYKIILKTGDFNKYKKMLSVSIEPLINKKNVPISKTNHNS